MTKSPILWGAGLACALGGAVAGVALGSTPILDRPSFGAYYQQHDTGYIDDAQDILPDHYPLVTREGTVPVAALSDRGLYSQRRYRAYVLAADYIPAEAVAYADYEPMPVRYASGDEGLSVGDPAPAARTSVIQPAVAPPDAARAPLALIQPAAVQANGNAKTINVNVALALQ